MFREKSNKKIVKNIRILPLQVYQNLVPQKCLLPEDEFPKGVVPGAWAKCIWNVQNNNFSVCQLFSQDFEQHSDYHCYMDSSVSSKPTFENQVLLEEIHILPNKGVVKWIEVIVELDEELYIDCHTRYTKSFVQNIIQTMLQPLHFILGSTVTTKDLKSWGICLLHITAADGILANEAFTVDETTKISFKDVKIFYPRFKRKDTILKEAFGKTYEDLRSYIKIIKNKNNKVKLPCNALVFGPRGSGKSTLIEVLIEDIKCNCFHVKPQNITGQYPGEAEASLRSIFTAAQTFEKTFKTNGIQLIILDDLQVLCPSNKTNNDDILETNRIACQLLNLVQDIQKTPSRIICLATTPSTDDLCPAACYPGRFDQTFSLTLPPEKQRKELLSIIFQEYSDSFQNLVVSNNILQFLAKRTQGYVVADLQLLVRNILQCYTRTRKRTFYQIAHSAMTKFVPTSMQGTNITVLKPSEGFDTVAGMDQLKKELTVSVLSAYKHQKAFERFGLEMPKGILLYGPPGCGKTMFAKCLAFEANMTFITTSGAEVYSPYVGQAEKFLAHLFDTARKHAPCLIFFDEIDTLVGKRAVDRSCKGDVQQRILTTMLTEMDGILHASSSSSLDPKHANDIMVVAATNRPDMLDDALIRPGRLSKLVHVPPPDLECRKQLLLMLSDTSPFANHINIEDLAKRLENFSGADIKNLVNEAALHALQKDIDADEITSTDFDEILKTLKPSLTIQQIEHYNKVMEKNPKLVEKATV